MCVYIHRVIVHAHRISTYTMVRVSNRPFYFSKRDNKASMPILLMNMMSKIVSCYAMYENHRETVPTDHESNEVTTATPYERAHHLLLKK